MAATITTQEVNNFYPNSVDETIVQIYIDTVAQADTCLDNKSVSEPQQKLLKLNAVAHLLSMQQGGGVKSEQDMDGESVTFRDSKYASSYLETLRGLEGYTCVQPYVDKPKRYSASLNSYYLK